MYEERVVCFLDILGFAETVAATVNTDGSENAAACEQLRDALLSIRNTLDVGGEHFAESKMVTQFSDSVVISFRVSERSEVFMTLLRILQALINLIQHRVVVRGGVALGHLVHTDKVLFGPALVEAYRLESQSANFPRVLVQPAIVDCGSQYHADHHDEDTERDYIEKCLAKDEDGEHFIDYFEAAWTELDDPDWDYPVYLSHMRDIICVGLAHPEQDVRSKYDWMRRKYNAALGECSSTAFLDGIQDEELYFAYSSIEPIA